MNTASLTSHLLIRLCILFTRRVIKNGYAQPPRISRPDDDDYRQERRQLIFLVAALLALSLILLASVLT
jgi:hypothetical protein